jgi:hypothetical protein
MHRFTNGFSAQALIYKCFSADALNAVGSSQ